MMTKIQFRLLLMGLSVLLASCSTIWPAKQPVRLLPQSLCLPSFPDRDGWYGGDGAYSIPLNDNRTLWLFGDTFVSTETGRKDRIGMDVILGTTLAVSTCSEDGAFKIQYHLNRKDGKFVSSFGRNEWLWPQDPFTTKGILYIPLIVIRSLPDVPPPFNFRVAGHKIVRIRDYTADDPHQWPVDYLDWTNALAAGIDALATTSVVHHDHVYFYPLYRSANANVTITGNILARIGIDHLDNPAGYFEYWTSDNTWQKELTPDKVKIIFPEGLSELSVRYHPQDRQWTAVYLSPENRGRQLFHATAENPEGPWSHPAVLIDPVSEVDPASPLYDQHNFCYAGKEHRQFARGRDLVVTYVCNSLEAANHPTSFIRRNLFLYRPVVKYIRR